MATHSSVLAWRIPGTGEPGGLPSMGSHRVRHDWNDLAAAAAVKWEQNLLFAYRQGNHHKALSTGCTLITRMMMMMSHLLRSLHLCFPGWKVEISMPHEPAFWGSVRPTRDSVKALYENRKPFIKSKNDSSVSQPSRWSDCRQPLQIHNREGESVLYPQLHDWTRQGLKAQLQHSFPG